MSSIVDEYRTNWKESFYAQATILCRNCKRDSLLALCKKNESKLVPAVVLDEGQPIHGKALFTHDGNFRYLWNEYGKAGFWIVTDDFKAEFVTRDSEILLDNISNSLAWTTKNRGNLPDEVVAPDCCLLRYYSTASDSPLKPKTHYYGFSASDGLDSVLRNAWLIVRNTNTDKLTLLDFSLYVDDKWNLLDPETILLSDHLGDGCWVKEFPKLTLRK